MLIRYVGASQDGLDIESGGRVWPAPHGAAVDVPDDIAAGLIARGDFEAVKAKKAPTTTTEEVNP